MEMISCKPASPSALTLSPLGSETIFDFSLRLWHLVPCPELGRCSLALLDE